MALRSYALRVAEGRPPLGWLSPWIAESAVTPDLLAEAGYGSSLNWCMDDQPVWMRTRAGPLLAIPYPQELNDIPAIVARRVTASATGGRSMALPSVGSVPRAGSTSPGEGR